MSYRTPKVFNGKFTKRKRNIQLPKFSFSFIKKLFVFIILIVLIFLFFFSSKFSIKEVMVDGNNSISIDTLKAFIPHNANIFRLNTVLIKNEILSKNPEIKDIQIIRGLPDAIKISVVEHENRMIWCSKDDKYLISVQGIVTKKITGDDNFNYPVVIDSKALPVKIGTTVVDSTMVAFVNNINDKFFDTTNIKPTNFEVVETTFDVNLYTEAGFYVKLNTLRSSQIQLDNLKKVLVEKRADINEYVDLRIDGWAYYK